MSSDRPLSGAVEMHVHSSPDVVPRAQNDVELARSAAQAEMRALVIKNHHFSTAGRAQLAHSVVPDVAVFGGLVLNRTSCGGLNPDAVRVTLALGGRIIWMPTVSARNHITFLRDGAASEHVRSLTPAADDGIAILDAHGHLDPALPSILDQIASADAILATGHLSAEETCALITEARHRGVTRIVVTHPEAPMIAMPLGLQRELAQLGVLFERCYYSILDGLPPENMLSTIREVGIESTIVATDLGQAYNPPPVDGYRAFHDALRAAGMAEAEWRRVACENPSRLLSLSTEV